MHLEIKLKCAPCLYQIISSFVFCLDFLFSTNFTEQTPFSSLGSQSFLHVGLSASLTKISHLVSCFKQIQSSHERPLAFPVS